jgi:hypothetical protein
VSRANLAGLSPSGPGRGSGRLQGLPDPAFAPALAFPGLASLGADFLLLPDLGRLRPIVSHSGNIRAIMLTGVS